MSKRITQEEWVTIIEEAAMSGVRVSEYCREKEISEKMFYRNTQKLGYTRNGKRTEKWNTVASSSEAEDAVISNLRTLVPVPVQTIQAAWSRPDSKTGDPQVAILHDSYRIIVGEDFSQETLRRVLEVMRNA